MYAVWRTGFVLVEGIHRDHILDEISYEERGLKYYGTTELNELNNNDFYEFLRRDAKLNMQHKSVTSLENRKLWQAF
ncbi:hypothetical protein HNR53_003747 [Bacillus benzoevorans]|uniref:Uncharacterized protein n=1 Tax=Bacillus benzoevorans TaxID=1456 RepID=A0A7X0LWY6_9BACI|nr:hypothetical protein [Bacillus benzoevorans]